MLRHRKGKRSFTLYCETCDRSKDFDEVRLLASTVSEAGSGPVDGTAPPPGTVGREEITDAHLRRAVWDRAMRDEFPDREDKRRGLWLECDRSHPISTGETLRICVIGLTQTGKTHLLAALFHLLLRDKVPHLAMTPMTDAEMQRIRPTIRDVFDLHQVAPETRWDRTESVQPFAFLLRLDLGDGSARTVAVNLYDFPGEHSEGAEKTKAFAPFVQSADALIFCVNPLSFKGFSEGLLQPPARAGDPPGAMFRRYAALWRDNRGYPNRGTAVPPTDVPIAVVLNRADVLCDHRDPEIAGLVANALEHDDLPSLEELGTRIDRHSQLTRALLTKAKEANLVRSIEVDYPLVRYFLASPLGSQPTKPAGENDAWTETPRTLAGVALPFLAVVYRLLDATASPR